MSEKNEKVAGFVSTLRNTPLWWWVVAPLLALVFTPIASIAVVAVYWCFGPLPTDGLPRRAWLLFWNYLLLPSAAIAFYLIGTGLASEPGKMHPVFGIWCALFCVTMYGLHCRASWVWTLNWLSVFSFTLIMPSSIWLDSFHKPNSDPAFVMGLVFLFGALVWFWPNFVYWKKRRCLFSPDDKERSGQFIIMLFCVLGIGVFLQKLGDFGTISQPEIAVQRPVQQPQVLDKERALAAVRSVPGGAAEQAREASRAVETEKAINALSAKERAELDEALADIKRVREGRQRSDTARKAVSQKGDARDCLSLSSNEAIARCSAGR